MRLIQPRPLTNPIFRDNTVVTCGVVGTILWDSDGKVLANDQGGYLLRTKKVEVDEGGINNGGSAYDSVCLI